MPASGLVYVRVDISSEQDSPAVYEGAETFALRASYTSNSVNSATANQTIVDDGTGAVYPGNVTGGGIDSVTTGLDDDQVPLAVANTYETFEDVKLVGNLITDDQNNSDPGGFDLNPVSATSLTVASVGGTAFVSLADSVSLEYLVAQGWKEASLQHGTLYVKADGGFEYVPNSNANGSESLTYSISNGVRESSTASVTIDVVQVNDAPSGTDASVTVRLGEGYVFTESDFGFTDSVEDHGFLSVVFTTLPSFAYGELQYQNGSSWEAVTAGDDVSTADIMAGKLRFEVTADPDDIPVSVYDVPFTFQVRDNGGTANGGVDLDQSANTFTLHFEQYVPSIVVPLEQSMDEDMELVFSSINGNAVTVSYTEATGIQKEKLHVLLELDANGMGGVLSLVNNNPVGLTVTNHPDGSIELAGYDTDISAALEGLKFTPDADEYSAIDNVGLNGSDHTYTQLKVTSYAVHTEGVVTPFNHASTTKNINIVVNAVDDVFTDGNEAKTILEDSSVSGNVLDNVAPSSGITGDGQITVESFKIGSDATVYVADGTEVVITDVGKLTLAANGAYTFIPLENYNGTVPTVSYTMSDGYGAKVDSTLNISVTAVPDAVIVSSPSVNEKSTYVVFTVQGVVGETVTLRLSDGTASREDASSPISLDGSEDFGPGLQVSLDGGASWADYSNGVTLTSTTLLVRTPIIDDNMYEESETFTLTALSVGGSPTDGIATIRDDGTGTVFNDDGTQNPTASKDDDRPTLAISPVTVSVSGVTVSESSPYAVFTVSLSSASTSAVSFTPSLTSVTATVGTDTGNTLEYFDGSSWVPASSGVTMAAGETSVLVRTAITQDATFEGSESFTLSTGAITGTVTNTEPATGTGTIVDDGTGTVFDQNGLPDTNASKDDDRPTFSISPVTVSEGGKAFFTVTRTGVSDVTQTVKVTTSLETGDTAEAGDFTSKSETLTFAAGVTTQTVEVQTTADAVYEGQETFTVTLSDATDGALISLNNGSAQGMIADDGTGTVFDQNGTPDTNASKDDDRPTFSISPVTVSEGGKAFFTVTRTGVSDVSQTVKVTTSLETGDTAEAGDFTSKSETLTFAAGVTTQTVEVQTTADAVYEGLETFTVTLSDATDGALISLNNGSAQGTIADDGTGTVFDHTGTPDTNAFKDDDRPAFSVSDITDRERDGTVTITVTKSGTTEDKVTIGYALSDGIAQSGKDYVDASGSVTFLPGDSSKTFDVTLLADDVLEASEDFNVRITVASGSALIDDGNAVVTLVESAPLAANDQVQVWQNLTLEATLPESTDADGDTVTYVLQTGPTNGSVAINSNGTYEYIPFKGYNGVDGFTYVVDDGFGGSNAYKVDITVLKLPTISVSTTTVSEADGYGVVTVSLSGVSDQPISFVPTLQSETAIVGTDTSLGFEYFDGARWMAVSDAGVTFAPGEQTKALRVGLVKDVAYDEGTESVLIKTGKVSTGGDGTGVTNPSGALGRLYITDVPELRSPVVTDVLENTGDPTPFDLLTSKSDNQVVTVAGEPQVTDLKLFVLEGGQFVESRARFTWVEGSPGVYELSFAAIPAGDFALRTIKDGYVSELSNTFTIDSRPGLRDIQSLRQLVDVPDGEGGFEQLVDGKTGVIDQNRVPGIWNGTNWVDSDGEVVRFGFDTILSFDKAAVPAGQSVQKVLDSGSSLTLDTRTGAYRYVPQDGAGIDIFVLTVSDGTKGARLTLTFDAKDILDRDGVGPDVETRLADLASGGRIGDLNGDGIPDKEQNAVATLAWIDHERYSSGMAGTLNEAQSIITVAVVEALFGNDVNTSKQLTGLRVLEASDPIVGGSKPDNADWDPLQFSVEPLDSVGLTDADPNRSGTQVRVLIDVARSDAVEGEFTAYMKYVSQTAIDGYANAGISLLDLDGNQVAQAGWYDFTRRTATGDGAKFIAENGKIVAIELLITDNRFGDNDATVDRIYDPGVPVGEPSGQDLVLQDQPFEQNAPVTAGPENAPIREYDGFVRQTLPIFNGMFYTQTFGLPVPEEFEPQRITVDLNASQAQGISDRGYASVREFAQPTLNSTALKNVVPLDVAVPEAPAMPDVELRNVFKPADLEVTAGVKTVYQLPNGTFVGGVGAVTLAARLVNGDPLPDWITFDSVTGKFTIDATHPLVRPVELLIEATDSAGNTANTMLKVEPLTQSLGHSVGQGGFIGKTSLDAQLQRLAGGPFTGTWG